MSDLRVERGSTAKLGHVDGDLKVSRNARITAAEGQLVTVSGSVRFESDAEVDCDLRCDSLAVERGTLKVTGNLTVSTGMDVAHTVKVDGKISAQEIEVGGRMYAGSVSCGSVRVGGIVEVAETLEAGSVDVGGKVLVRGPVKIKDFGVGGKAEVGGGSISGLVKVGGVFASSGPLEFGEMRVSGKCTLAAGCKGHKISTFGKLSVAGALSCEEIEVEGVTDVRGDCSAGKMLVNGRLEVSGSLVVAGTLETNGWGQVRDEVRGADLRVGGRFRARKILISNQAEIAGELIETQQGLKAKSVMVGSGTTCKGPVVGERVELGRSSLNLVNWGTSWAGQSVRVRGIGRMTNAEDIYGEEVVLGKHSRCGRIFAKRVEVAEGCTVEQVVYTEELRGAVRGNSFFTRPPEKVQSLPPFPL
jgi:cytoskeletal protein CcmA (bactofilin family)